ncbi:hypothetical protein H5410_002828 [Solanum commersonii]|uniref:Uncharacterized protein n=1 Tax=Solanum commersonii TaxID=4109 RepID=A0A9J6B3Y8_SOLCO|nr:hypothetical protein H5410_002828 [Solanum commersonii]
MTMSKKNYIESSLRELLIDIVERIASTSLLKRFNEGPQSNMVDSSRSHFFPGNMQSIGEFRKPYLRKGVIIFMFLHMYSFLSILIFQPLRSTTLGMINQAASGGHVGASYVLAIISIFNGGESMREGGMWVPEPHLLGGRPICCLVHHFEQIGHEWLA